MKLSEKGLGKLYNSKACYYDDETEEEVVALSYFEHVFEFEADDFQGMVCLTVEEAKAVLDCVDACAFPSPFDGFVSKNILLRDKLKKRIEQEEVQDEIK